MKTFKLEGDTFEKVRALHERGEQLQRDITANQRAMWKAVDAAFPETVEVPRSIDASYLEFDLLFLNAHTPDDEPKPPGTLQ